MPSLTPEFWKEYCEKPQYSQEFKDEEDRAPPESRGRINEDRDYARWTADALDLKPSDWDNPAYRKEYRRRIIVAEFANTFWLVGPGRVGAKSLSSFIEKHQGVGVIIHRFDVLGDTYTLELTPELARQMKERGFEMQPVTPGSITRRGR